MLENIAKALIFSHSMFLHGKFDYKYTGLYFSSNIHDRLKHSVLRMPSSFALNSIVIKHKNTFSGEYFSFEDIKEISDFNRVREDSFVFDKPIVFVGAKNRGFTKNIDSNNIKILPNTEKRFVDSFERTLRYINAEGLEHEEIVDWFASRLIINPSFVASAENRKQEAVTVLQLIDRLEPGLNLVTANENGDFSIKLMYDEGRLLVNGIPLDKLSTGFVSVIKIFQEIVAGYSGWNNRQNLNEVDGVVFIDELEPHLHISWQTRIIGILREFFPNTTFYISTHSPLVLSGLKTGEAYELLREGDVVKSSAISHIENYFLTDMVREFFGVDLDRIKIDHVDRAKQKAAKQQLLAVISALQEDEQ
ncbi:MAG: AAA family ATPase [Methylococcales bacterium]|nr:AAA family ATPase [Methylococcales bacterium]